MKPESLSSTTLATDTFSLTSIKESSIRCCAALAAARLEVALVDRLAGSTVVSQLAVLEVALVERKRVFLFGLAEAS